MFFNYTILCLLIFETLFIMCIYIKNDNLDLQNLNDFKCLVEQFCSNPKSMAVTNPKEFDMMHKMLCECFLYFAEEKIAKKNEHYYTNKKKTVNFLKNFTRKVQTHLKILSSKKKTKLLPMFEIVAAKAKKYIKKVFAEFNDNFSTGLNTTKIFLFVKKINQLYSIKEKDKNIKTLMSNLEFFLKKEFDLAKYNKEYVRNDDEIILKQEANKKKRNNVSRFLFLNKKGYMAILY